MKSALTRLVCSAGGGDRMVAGNADPVCVRAVGHRFMCCSSLCGTLVQAGERPISKHKRHELTIPWPNALLASRRTHLRQFCGWFVLGLVAFAAEVALLDLLYQRLRCPLWFASAVAAEAVLLARFMTTDRLVFGQTKPTFVRCVRFHAAAAGSFAVSWLVLNGSATLLGVPYVAAVFMGSVAAFLLSALTNFLWVWRRTLDEDSAAI